MLLSFHVGLVVITLPFLKLHSENNACMFRTFSTSPAACWCSSSPNLYPEILL